jgi:hypothetical protein
VQQYALACFCRDSASYSFLIHASSQIDTLQSPEIERLYSLVDYSTMSSSQDVNVQDIGLVESYPEVPVQADVLLSLESPDIRMMLQRDLDSGVQRQTVDFQDDHRFSVSAGTASNDPGSVALGHLWNIFAT